jgi:hypothetical protein
VTQWSEGPGRGRDRGTAGRQRASKPDSGRVTVAANITRPDGMILLDWHRRAMPESPGHHASGRMTRHGVRTAAVTRLARLGHGAGLVPAARPRRALTRKSVTAGPLRRLAGAEAPDSCAGVPVVTIVVTCPFSSFPPPAASDSLAA